MKVWRHFMLHKMAQEFPFPNEILATVDKSDVGESDVILCCGRKNEDMNGMVKKETSREVQRI